MDRRTLLVLILSTIYIERKHTSAINHIEYYEEVLEKSKPLKVETSNIMELGTDPVAELEKLIVKIKDFNTPIEDTEAFLQKVRLACTHDSYLFESVELFVRPAYTEEEIKRKIQQTRATIGEYLANLSLREIMTTAYRLVNYDNKSRDETIVEIDGIVNRLLDVQVKLGAIS